MFVSGLLNKLRASYRLKKMDKKARQLIGEINERRRKIMREIGRIEGVKTTETLIEVK